MWGPRAHKDVSICFELAQVFPASTIFRGVTLRSLTCQFEDYISSTMVTSESRKSQARESQRRSRAQRRAQADALRNRVLTLSRALEEIIDACVHFSDLVISALQPENDDSCLKAGVQPFIGKALQAAYIIEQDAPIDEYIAPTFNDLQNNYQYRPPAQDACVIYRNTRAPSLSDKLAAVVPVTDSSALRAMMSPRWTYGLLPEMRPARYGVPSDISAYIQSVTALDVPLGTNLYWNTLFFAYDTLVLRSRSLAPLMFAYALPFSSVNEILNRIQYRLQYKPNTVILCIPAPQDWEVTGGRAPEVESSLPPGSLDVEHEASELTRHRSQIEQAMSRTSEHLASFIDPAGVEEYLYSHWGIVKSTPPQRIGSAVDSSEILRIPLSEQGERQLIQGLVLRSRCLGDRIGFPVEAVDEAALQYIRTTLDN
jgi:hypothetical protein